MRAYAPTLRIVHFDDGQQRLAAMSAQLAQTPDTAPTLPASAPEAPTRGVEPSGGFAEQGGGLCKRGTALWMRHEIDPISGDCPCGFRAPAIFQRTKHTP